MKLNHIIVAVAALASGSSFAAAVQTNTPTTGTGLMLAVTNTVTGQSYDFDLGTTFATYQAQIANTGFTQSWTLDSAWASFYNASNAANYEWTVFGSLSKGGTTTIAGNYNFMTTVNNSQSAATVTGQAATNVALVAGKINEVAVGINSLAAPGSSSAIADVSKNDAAYFGPSQGANSGALTDTFNGMIVGNTFMPFSAIGDTASFLSVTNAPGARSIGTYNATTFANAFSLTAAGALTYGPLATTPAVPEPSTYGLALVGLLVVGAMARRRA